jgi:RNA polymerase sigma-70 factor (ECF subfamily)
LGKHVEDNEAHLISSLKDGSHKAFDSIYRMYARRLYAYSLQFTKSREEAEDIVQDVFVKLWTSREKIRQEDTLRSLLFIMAKHHIINAFHSKINQPVYEEYVNYRAEMSVDDTHWHLEYQEFVAKLRDAMETLPATQRKVITLSKIQQFSNKEIAEKLSLSEQTVKNSLSMGLNKLKQELGEQYAPYALLFVNFVHIIGTMQEI